MIQLKKGDKVCYKAHGLTGRVRTVIALDNDNLHMSIQDRLNKGNIQSPVLIDDYILTEISVERWKEMTTDEQLEYLKLHPELNRQWVVSWFGISEHGHQSGCERLGAVETLIEHKNPSNGILAETFNKILHSRSYLKTVAILNFWEV